MKALKTSKIIALIAILSFCLGTVSSCQKYRKYDNLEVVEDNFDGNFIFTSSGSDPAGDFTGVNKSGTYSFAWENSKKRAQVNFDITTSGVGSVQVKVNDAKGDEVLNVTRPEGGEDTFSGVTKEGKKGKWLVTFVFTNIKGDGSFSINPGD